MNYPEFVKISRIVQENEKVKSIFFPLRKKVTPGQFIMVMIPDVDEIPMSVSRIDDGEISFTFKKVGEATSKLFNMKEGNVIGIRGPLGEGFELKGEKILFVAGGTGIAPIRCVAEKSARDGRENTIIIGAKTESELFMVDELERFGRVIISTDDGSRGLKGTALDTARKFLDEESVDMVITCGPEIMMKKLLDLCVERNIFFQASVERYIKCGLGICGQCCIDGLRVCKDGPVFDGETLKKCRDFGVFRRDAAGRRIYFE